MMLGCCLAAVSSAEAFTVFAPDETVKTEGGNFSISFGEYREFLGDSFDTELGQWVSSYGDRQTGMAPGSEYYASFVNSVVRAFNTMEDTIASKPSRTMNVQVVFAVDSGRTQGASADPWWQDYSSGNNLLTYGDLGVSGEQASTVARVNKVEYLWKYGKSDAGTAASYDVQITFRSPTVYADGNFGSFFVGENPADYTAGQYDVETITLHEMGHVLGFHTGAGTVNGGESAMDLLTESQPSSLLGGGLEWHFTGETTTALNGGEDVRLMPGVNSYDPHTRSPEGLLMADGTRNPGTMRDFTELEKAMLQDLGWELTNPIVLPATPEPSTATLSLLALAGLLARRRR